MALGHAADKLSISLKRFILDEELAEMTGRRLVVRVKSNVERQAQPNPRGRPATSRWRRPIDLRWPASGSIGRPRSSAGATSFHLRIVTRSRNADSSRGAPASAATGGGDGGMNAVAFDFYVSNGLTVTEVDAGRFDGYVANTGEVLDADEQDAILASRVSFLLSNIDDDPERRRAFWTQRQEAARKRGDHAILLVPAHGSVDDWRALQRDRAIPHLVRQEIANILRQARANGRAGRQALPRGKRTIRLDGEAEIAWARGFAARFGERKQDRMLHHVEPRGGVVQESFDAEIPIELGLDGAIQAARELGALFARAKLPFLVAVHSPDADNDARNLHLHLIYFPQPGERDGDGNWTFGKAGSGASRLRPGDLARMLASEGGEVLSGHHKERAAADIGALRGAWADICNAALEATGENRRLDPRSFEVMGIAKQPEHHLGNAEMRLLEAGITTPTSRRNMTSHWRWTIEERLAALARTFARTMAPVTGMDAAIALTPALVGERERLVAEADALHADWRDLVLLDTREEIARSGATRLDGTCERMLERIAAGAACAADCRQRDAIARRRGLAAHHLLEINDAVAPWRGDVERDRRGLERRERALSHAVVAFVADVQASREAAQADAVQTSAAGTGVVPNTRFDKSSVAVPHGASKPRITHSAQSPPASSAIVELTETQWQEVDRVVAAITANGREATAAATRGQTDVPRADAVLYERYRNHPHVKPCFTAAEYQWASSQGSEAGSRVGAAVPKDTVLSVGSQASTKRPDVPASAGRMAPAVVAPLVTSPTPMPEKSDRPSAAPLGSEHRGPSPAEPVPAPQQAADLASGNSALPPATLAKPDYGLAPTPRATKPLPVAPTELDSGATVPRPGAVKHLASNVPGQPTAGSSSTSITPQPDKERPGREGTVAIKAEEASQPPRRDETETKMGPGAAGAKKSAGSDPMITTSREDGSSAGQPADAHRSPDAGEPVVNPVVSVVDAAAEPAPAAEESASTNEAKASSAASAADNARGLQRVTPRMDRLRDAVRERAAAKRSPSPVARASKVSPAGDTRSSSEANERQSGQRQRTVEEKQRVAKTAAVPDRKPAVPAPGQSPTPSLVPDPDADLAWLQQQRDWKSGTGQGR